MSNPMLVDEIQKHNVRKASQGESCSFAIGKDFLVTFKAAGHETGYAFSCYEVELGPGQGIPLHKHPYAEFFYVVQGRVDFERWDNQGNREWVSCDFGDSLVAPPNAPHAFMNHSEQLARFIATSTFHHELMLKQTETPEGLLEGGYAKPTFDGFDMLKRSQARDQVFYFDAKTA